jgi:peptidoglycan/LPS O-acetylase OafA/YrhL
MSAALNVPTTFVVRSRVRGTNQFRSAKGRIPSLDGLRAISITLVVLSHLMQLGHIPASVVGSYGKLGVHVFFVLSGYLITNPLLQEFQQEATVNLRAFYLRRGFRIFPAALVFLGVAIYLYRNEMRWYHIAAAMLYFANMDLTRPLIFGHLWSLSIEEQFYLIWPLAIKKWYRHSTAILISVLIASPMFRACIYALHVRNGLISSLPVFADQLAIGCLLAVSAPRLPAISKSAAFAMLIGVFTIQWFPAASKTETLLTLFILHPILNVCIAGLVLHVIQTPYRALNWRSITWIGTISYSLYLWQELFCGSSMFQLGYALILPTLACGCLSYYLVERPMLRIRDKLERIKAERGSQALISKAASIF